MVKLTPNAVAALTTARTESGAPNTFGVRLFTSADRPDDDVRLSIEFVAFPEPKDTLVRGHGLKAYVAPEVADRVGDATVDVEDGTGQLQLVLRG